jgi:hypothetical protein
MGEDMGHCWPDLPRIALGGVYNAVFILAETEAQNTPNSGQISNSSWTGCQNGNSGLQMTVEANSHVVRGTLYAICGGKRGTFEGLLHLRASRLSPI